MLALKGIYHDGKIELIEKPEYLPATEILVIFPEVKKQFAKIGGSIKNAKIDYALIEKDLKQLNRKSEENLLKDF